MGNEGKLFGPVVISGVGGSGTRVVAHMLIEMGFYMGRELNQAYDNLWFTLLFRRPRWYMKRAYKDKELVLRGLDILTRIMVGSLRPNWGELRFIMRAMFEKSYARHRTPQRIIQILQFIIRAIRSEDVNLSRYSGWGWKCPNSHIYIDYLREYYENLRFIHVIRHGLDMAYSKNRNQLFLWGAYFGVDIPPSPALLPRAALEYWIRANRRVITCGEKMGGEKFILVNFDDLCAFPREETAKIVTFVGLEAENRFVNKLSGIPKTPPSQGRYKGQDLSLFSHAQLDAVHELGFEIQR